MARKLFHFLLVILLSATSATALAQVAVKGQVVDASTGEPLIGATVTVVGGSQGAITDIDGNFSLNAPQNATISIQYLGYKELKRNITLQGNLGVIQLESDAFALDDVIITSSVAVARKTPVAMTTLDPVFIQDRLGMQDFPELLKSTPGVYVSKEGGGFGDTDITLRGFGKENIAVMVNGVPMNDMEWGGVYWSNWTSLSDVTRNQQVQRGLGAAKLSAPSVGGSINIITYGVEAKKGGTASYGIGENGFNKLTFSVSTGLSKNGWAMTLMGGKEWADGYIQGTEYEAYTYFMNLSKRINDNHQLTLTAFGSPQWHNQRSRYDGLTIEGWQEAKKYMPIGQQYRYNPTYGFDKNGVQKAANKNRYHKPQISLNHMWQIDMTSSLSSSFYVSIGDGWGHSGQTTNEYSGAWYGASNGTLTTKYRKADGTFAYDEIQDINEKSENGSQMIMSLSENKHRWYGLLSTYTKEINDWNLYGGIDARYYKGIHTNKISDLYNGAYYIDRNRANVKGENHALAGDPSFVNEKLTVGDVVYRDYDGFVMQGGVFGQAEYSNEIISAFVSGSVNATRQWRYDRFYYDAAHAESEKVNKTGFTVKAGANYNINENHNVFANIGYMSRVPFMSKGIFFNVQNSHAVNPDSKNEKTFGVEIGYGFQSRYFSANLNAYHTEWRDKLLTNSAEIVLEDGTGDRASVNIQGVNAIHDGIELEFVAKPLKWLNIKGMFSIGDWRWVDDAVGYWYTSNGLPLNNKNGIASGIGAEDHATSKITFDDTKVGKSAQTTAALLVDIMPVKDIRVSVDWHFMGRHYAEWEIKDPTVGSAQNYTTPWRIPSASTFDLSASYKFKIGGLQTTLSGNINNIFDQEYIQSAYDGSGDWETAYRVFYGFGRQMSMKLRVNF